MPSVQIGGTQYRVTTGTHTHGLGRVIVPPNGNGVHAAPAHPCAASVTSCVWPAMAHAASEDRTHDLRIMRPTRCQLRYRRRC